MSFYCSACVSERMQEDGIFEVCKNCGGTCVPSDGVIPSNITVAVKEKKITVSNSFLGLIFHPAQTAKNIVGNLSLSFLLTRLLPIYVISVLLEAALLSASIPRMLIFQISILILFVIVIEAICRMASVGEERIRGAEYILEMLAGAMYVFTILNVCGILLSFIPSAFVREPLSIGVELWCYCLWAFFVSEIYGVDFKTGLLLSFVAFLIAVFIGPFGMRMI